MGSPPQISNQIRQTSRPPAVHSRSETLNRPLSTNTKSNQIRTAPIPPSYSEGQGYFDNRREGGTWRPVHHAWDLSANFFFVKVLILRAVKRKRRVPPWLWTASISYLTSLIPTRIVEIHDRSERSLIPFYSIRTCSKIMLCLYFTPIGYQWQCYRHCCDQQWAILTGFPEIQDDTCTNRATFVCVKFHRGGEFYFSHSKWFHDSPKTFS